MIKKIIISMLVMLAILGCKKEQNSRYAEETVSPTTKTVCFEISNGTYRLTVTKAENELQIKLLDVAMDFTWSDGPYLYTAKRWIGSKQTDFKGLTSIILRKSDNSIQIEGELAGLKLRHTFTLPSDQSFMEETLVVNNPTDTKIALVDLQTSFQRLVTDEEGNVLPVFAQDRLIAVPFRHCEIGRAHV